MDKVYPIGSIYITINSSNPKNLFGGVWEQLKDRFLLGYGDTYNTINGTGGSASESHSHTNSDTGSTTLTTSQIPSHRHTGIQVNSKKSATWWYIGREDLNRNSVIDNTNNGDVGVYQYADNGYKGNFTADHSRTGAYGGGQGHTHTMSNTGNATVNKLPPYLIVYMWKRIS